MPGNTSVSVPVTGGAGGAAAGGYIGPVAFAPINNQGSGGGLGISWSTPLMLAGAAGAVWFFFFRKKSK
jgi:hypothetical protein